MARVWIGTSGFSYPEWKPSFYPEKLPARRFLEHYASRLNAVEIDYTFYRMPNAKTLDAWRAATPERFRFAIKASRRITHQEKLALPSSSLEYLLQITPRLGERLGAILYQLPPFLRCDLGRLEAFLGALPGEGRSVFEFRHVSWFVPEVYCLLEKHRVALCVNDGDEKTTPAQLTAPFTYLRLRKSAYAPEQMEEWCARIRGWVEAGTDVLAFIKHEDNPDAPLIALDFARGLADVS